MEQNEIEIMLNQSKEELLIMILEINKFAAKKAHKNIKNIKEGIPLDKSEIEEQKQLRFQVSQLEACYKTACIKDKLNGKQSATDIGKIKDMLTEAKNNMGNLVGEIPKQ